MKAGEQLYLHKCRDCGIDIQTPYTTHLRVQKRGYHLCKECNYKDRMKKKAEWFAKLSDEERTKMAKISKENGSKKFKMASPDEKKQIQKNMKKVRDKFHASLSEKEKEELKEKRKNGLNLYWKDLSQEERDKKIETAIDNLQKSWDNKDLYREDQAQSARGRYNSMTSEEQESFMQKIWKGHEKWLETMSEEERKELSISITLKRSQWYKSLNEEERQNIRDKIKESWDRLSPKERGMRIRLSLTNANGENKFHQKFLKTFKDSYISNTFYPSAEVITNENGITKSWDYGIYDKETESLQMVVDLDGSFIHADNSDYNGIHSREQYDERRYSSVPDGIKCHIINDFEFQRSFDKMIRLLMIDYDQFIEEQFELCRSLKYFPYPTYSDEELMKSFNQLLKLDPNSKYINLSTRNREGDRLIHHFHQSIYHSSVGKNPSPYDAWWNDKLLREVIRNRVIYVNTLNPNKILQGFNISKIAPKVSVFSAGRAKLLINRYLHDYNEIFDPFSGFSGRMLGAISLGKQYIGQDISQGHIVESNKMINFLAIEKMAFMEEKNIFDSSGEYESLFTCPPYGDKEKWNGISPREMNCDGWIDECLKRFKCRRYLFVIDKTERYTDKIVDTITNRSHFNSNTELVIVINNIG